ncbi:right-handed parallel beta-helix repeat-containing protein [Cerasicoccus arenae]|uniref:Right handed beta helix domain-containing protein n=1 Tax=Cerasicoccus arenae TaxID=424488 RepID=A0A8J3DCN5_9BACT|nr:right-handed parallel beta-helix repeat-containing protein [Cerasicoccus arenae]MBK1859610.1 right-handed parallel beta-helix repeat-containing protein [Cerasicoccus arenae]GHC03600.1 hypothetical protein GCM10007047_20260 [Cerasicoccus arenae]
MNKCITLVVRNLLVLLIFTGVCSLSAATTYVHPGDDLGAILNSANPGDTVMVYPGEYGRVVLADKNGTETDPIIIRSMGGATIKSYEPYENALWLKNCDYIVFDVFTFTGGMRGAIVVDCDHIIFKNCTFTGVGQEGIHILSSHYVDVRGGKIYNTGLLNPQWGEGVYAGSGSAYDLCSHIWVEGVEIYNTGNGEAVDYKPGVSHSTIRGCVIHDIAPGTSTQSNEGAIVVNGYDTSVYVLPAPQYIWIENNLVYNISGGLTGKNRGIVFFGSGVYVKSNIVHDCDDEGILGSNWNNAGFTNWSYANWCYDNDPNSNYQYGNVVNLTDPGLNSQTRQVWFP